MTRTALFILLACICAAAAHTEPLPKADGYRGIWYFNQKIDSPYVYKYSGGLGTYCMKHVPMAVYAPKANKTFFVYGGTKPGKQSLLEMVSYYDHATGQVPRPTILLDKKTSDAHDNPVLAIDGAGHLWIFASAHGTARPAYIFKSKQPYTIDEFDQVVERNFSYPQPWYMGDRGFLFMHTLYEDNGRSMFCATSPDGLTWSEPRRLARIDSGHYQVTWPHENKVGSAFDYHPAGKGLNARTNLYYLETQDMGETWHTVAGEPITPPLTEAANPALIHDYAAEGLVMYVKDLNFDPQGRPAILHVTSRGWVPGPENGPYEMRVAYWRDGKWEIKKVAPCDHNYDSGSLYIDPDGTWRVIAPTEPGPQPYGTGGEIALWTSTDAGATWNKTRDVTTGSPYNHGHVRRPLNAHPDFYAYWADGDARKESESRLYFCDKNGQNLRQLPTTMETDFATPEP